MLYFLSTVTLCHLAFLSDSIVSHNSVTPVEKVIKLLEDLKTEIEDEGKAESTTYDKFACFCKDNTETKSKSITKGVEKIDSLTADIEADTASQAAKSSELEDRQAKHEELGASLEEETTKCAKEMAEYEAVIADLAKGLDSLDKAIKAMKDSKPSSFLAIRQTVGESLKLADALSLIKAPKRQAVSAFLQQSVDPSDAEYKFHSEGIIDTLQDLQKDFTKQKGEQENELEKAKKACDKMKKSLTEQMKTNSESMDTLKTDIQGLKKTIAGNREELISAEGLLEDDQTYLKDLTTRCDSRAQEWDQRTQLRGDEIKAITQALAILKDKKVKELDEEVNKRALLLQSSSSGGAVAHLSTLSFLQQNARSKVVARDLQTKSTISLQSTDGQEAHAIAVLREAGVHLKSEMLASLVAQVEADPFAKVKTLIQKLIQRLLDEAAQEATKKGFCDEKLGKAKNERKFKFTAVKRVAADLKVLEARKEELKEEMPKLTKSIEDLGKALNETQTEREQSKSDNLKAIKKAREGLAAVEEAITVLKEFYKKSSKSFIQASPVEADDPGAGFKGEYEGKQDGAKGIIGLLEVVQSDFKRTITQTKEDEKAAQADFVKFEQTSKSDIAGKTTQLQLDEEESKKTEKAIDEKTSDLETQQKLLDDALKAIEDLKPMCIDTGMSYEDRKTKREEEIAALKKAMCHIDPDGVEPDCSS